MIDTIIVELLVQNIFEQKTRESSMPRSAVYEQCQVLQKQYWEALPMKLLYVGDLVLIAELEELVLKKARKWKKGMLVRR